MAAPIVFYFDFISPYAYLAWHEIHALAETHGRELELRPVLFAALLNHWGQLGPAEIPPKRLHTFKQVLRWAAARDLHLEPPPAHPFNPLLALRLACVELPQAERRALIDHLFRATWGGGPGVAGVDTVREGLVAAGLDAPALLSAAMRPENKQRLIANGELALRHGVFGVPTMVVDGELFWGVDTLPEIDAFLRGEDPLDPALLERWRELPVGTARKQSR